MQVVSIWIPDFAFHDRHNHPGIDNWTRVETLRIQTASEDRYTDHGYHHKFSVGPQVRAVLAAEERFPGTLSKDFELHSPSFEPFSQVDFLELTYERRK